jgi:ribosomal protein L25 (general stress protein Ctc)
MTKCDPRPNSFSKPKPSIAISNPSRLQPKPSTTKTQNLRMAQFLRGKAAAAAGAAVLRASSPAPWRRTASASYHHTIQAVPRETAGPRAAARERRHGRVPAVLLTLAGAAPGNGIAHRHLLTADRRQLAEMLKQSPYFLSTPVRLQVRAGERSNAILHAGTVLPIKVTHILSYSHKILHLLSVLHIEIGIAWLGIVGRELLTLCLSKCSLVKMFLANDDP